MVPTSRSPTGLRRKGRPSVALAARDAAPPESPVLVLSGADKGGLVSGPMDERAGWAWAAEVAELKGLLRERAEVIELLMAHAPIGIFQTDAAGRLVRANARWRHIAGLTHVREPRGVWWQMVDPVDRDRVLAQWEGALNHGYEFQSEFRVNTGLGHECYVRTRIMPIVGPESVLQGCVGVAEDITERRRLECELRRAQADLEQRVKDRTAQLESVNRELQQFAHLVAHDLKAPLRAVSNLADWVAQDYAAQVDAKGQEWLALLRQRVRYMHDLIEGVLALSQLGLANEPEIDVDLNALLARVLAGLAPPAHIRIHIPQDLPRVSGSPERLQQVFQNLLDNAIKYMDKSEGVVVLRFERLPAAWQFAVADNGPGIEPRFHTRVFGMFVRLRHEDRSRSTGIGLALVKKIVETRGGQITLESEVGQGATFTFSWPDKAPRVNPAAGGGRP